MIAPWDVPSTIEEFADASAWFLQRVPMTKDAWLRLDEKAQRKAFTVAQVTCGTVIQDVFSALDRAVKTGTAFGDFKKDVGQLLRDSWNRREDGSDRVANPAWRIETIYRTNIGLAYDAGQYHQMSGPDILEMRPYWQYDAIVDNRVSEECEEAHGTILPHDHPWWDKNYPTRHFNCRCSVRSIRTEQAEKRGTTKEPPEIEGQAGFGRRPDAEEWYPDMSRDMRRRTRTLRLETSSRSMETSSTCLRHSLGMWIKSTARRVRSELAVETRPTSLWTS